MSVYIDKSNKKLGRMKMCHMIADSLDELLSFGLSIGLKKEWIQYNETFPHFDISIFYKEKAIKLGILELNNMDFAKKIKDLKNNNKEYYMWNFLRKITKDKYNFEGFFYNNEKYTSVYDFIHINKSFNLEKFKISPYEYALRIKIMKLGLIEELLKVDRKKIKDLNNETLLKIWDDINKNLHILNKPSFFLYFKENEQETILKNRHKTKDKNFVYIGRGTPFGNSNSSFDGEYSKEESVKRYQYDFDKKIKHDIDFKKKILLLKGRTLLCSCNNVCHGNVIKKYLDNVNFNKEINEIKEMYNIKKSML